MRWMAIVMVYFDTNILLYAFMRNVDSEDRKELATSLIEEAIENRTLIVSKITLCEFAYVSRQLSEEQNNIDKNLKFISKFLQLSNFNINQRMIKILNKTKLHISSFDSYHLAFAEYYHAKLFTFDDNFENFKDIAKVEIDIR